MFRRQAAGANEERLVDSSHPLGATLGLHCAMLPAAREAVGLEAEITTTFARARSSGRLTPVGYAARWQQNDELEGRSSGAVNGDPIPVALDKRRGSHDRALEPSAIIKYRLHPLRREGSILRGFRGHFSVSPDTDAPVFVLTPQTQRFPSTLGHVIMWPFPHVARRPPLRYTSSITGGPLGGQ